MHILSKKFVCEMQFKVAAKANRWNRVAALIMSLNGSAAEISRWSPWKAINTSGLS